LGIFLQPPKKRTPPTANFLKKLLAMSGIGFVLLAFGISETN
jgi:hypothetical protein